METLLTLLGTAGSLVFQWLGLSKAEEQQAASLSAQSQWRTEDIEREEMRYGMEYGLRRREMKEAKEEREKTWKWKEEERDYIQNQNTVNRFLGLLDKDPASKDRLMMTWNSARVK
jgi:hypothetical protein